MRCPRCHHENREEARFCAACGDSFAARCPACGHQPPSGAAFCDHCGTSLTGTTPAATRPPLVARPQTPQVSTPPYLVEKILQSRTALEGERKQVTVLFADLKGSMELLADRDPEEARRLLDLVLERMMAAVHRYEGTVNQVMGDGIMALFGAPIAHEDHAVRACYAALHMQESIGRYAAELRLRLGLDVQIRVGLNAGEVVVRSIGNDLHMDYTAVGQTTHLAARMEQLARPGTALLTADTLQGALELAAAGGDVVLHALAHQYLGFAYQAQRDYRRAIDSFRQTVASLDGARRRERFGQLILPAVDSRAELALCDAELGRFAEGLTVGEEALGIAEAVAHPASLIGAACGIGLLAQRQGDLPRALPRLEQAVSLCQDVDLPVLFSRAAAALGAAYTLSGRVADAVPLLTHAMAQTAATEVVVHQALCRFSLGEAQLLAGRLEEAQALAERALALTRQHQERGHQAYALRLLGDLATRREPRESGPAEDDYRQTLVLAEELGMRPLVAHCHRGLGTLYAKIGHREQARAEGSIAIELYKAMDMTFWLPQSEAALAQVEGR
jgi:class 3 adenylate cyclase